MIVKRLRNILSDKELTEVYGGPELGEICGI
ncbi:TPA: bacteriocin [Candidatus Bathyarchaeota archaeon]|nr:bacteriocin [Candidatus Bathyarchaeota archaeon]